MLLYIISQFRSDNYGLRGRSFGKLPSGKLIFTIIVIGHEESIISAPIKSVVCYSTLLCLAFNLVLLFIPCCFIVSL